MKIKYFFTSILFFAMFSSSLLAQKKNDKHNHNIPINKVYFDLSVGGLFTFQGNGYNGNLGLGYQWSTLLGIGLGVTLSTDINDLSNKTFSGIGLEYRLNQNNWFAKFSTGIVLDYTYPSDFEEYEYLGKKDSFYRLALGCSPKGSFLNFGIVLNTTRGKFDYYNLTFNPIAGVTKTYQGIVSKRIISPQFYIGIKFPKLKKKRND